MPRYQVEVATDHKVNMNAPISKKNRKRIREVMDDIRNEANGFDVSYDLKKKYDTWLGRNKGSKKYTFLKNLFTVSGIATLSLVAFYMLFNKDGEKINQYKEENKDGEKINQYKEEDERRQTELKKRKLQVEINIALDSLTDSNTLETEYKNIPENPTVVCLQTFLNKIKEERKKEEREIKEEEREMVEKEREEQARLQREEQNTDAYKIFQTWNSLQTVQKRWEKKEKDGAIWYEDSLLLENSRWNLPDDEDMHYYLTDTVKKKKLFKWNDDNWYLVAMDIQTYPILIDVNIYSDEWKNKMETIKKKARLIEKEREIKEAQAKKMIREKEIEKKIEERKKNERTKKKERTTSTELTQIIVNDIISKEQQRKILDDMKGNFDHKNFALWKTTVYDPVINEQNKKRGNNVLRGIRLVRTQSNNTDLQNADPQTENDIKSWVNENVIIEHDRLIFKPPNDTHILCTMIDKLPEKTIDNYNINLKSSQRYITTNMFKKKDRVIHIVKKIKKELQ